MAQDPQLMPLQALLQYLESNADYLRLRRGLGPVLQGYEPAQAVSPAGVLYHGSALAGSLGRLSVSSMLPCDTSIRFCLAAWYVDRLCATHVRSLCDSRLHWVMQLFSSPTMIVALFMLKPKAIPMPCFRSRRGGSRGRQHRAGRCAQRVPGAGAKAPASRVSTTASITSSRIRAKWAPARP